RRPRLLGHPPLARRHALAPLGPRNLRHEALLREPTTGRTGPGGRSGRGARRDGRRIALDRPRGGVGGPKSSPRPADKCNNAGLRRTHFVTLRPFCMRSEAIKPGDVIAGKYRVRAIMSRSRGFLVEAFHTEFDQRVAIRILSPHLVDDKEVERFRREARTLAKLESEHVARILDVGTTQDGAFYFARQYLEGVDLERHLKQRGALPLADAVLMILQVSEAVTETHVHNIILRELQPSHLFLTERLGGSPQVKIVDFGT